MSDKLLSLNLIVGPNESAELARCLNSCKGPLFDQICVTIATPDPEKEIELIKVAKEYTDCISYFKWIQDFSAARNFNFSQSKCGYIYWLDADDIIKPDNYQKLLERKSKIAEYDMIMLQYVYAHDNADKPYVVLPRERIVRNCDRIKWHDPIHEYLNMDPDFKMVRWDDIFIDHYRTKPFNPKRNLDILEQEYAKPECSDRTRFYYGKELSDNGDWDKAVPVLEDCVNRGTGFHDNLAVACIKLARYYYTKKDLNASKGFALKGINYSSNYAEHYVTLGDCYWDLGDRENAIQYYHEAMTKQVGSAGMSQMTEFYRFIPAWRLSTIYLVSKDYDKAIKYCKIALDEKPDNNEVKQLAGIIEAEMKKGSTERALSPENRDKLEKFLKELSFKFEVEDNNVDYARIKLERIFQVSIAWLVPIYDLKNPSIRLRRWNIHTQLEKMGVQSKFIHCYYGKSVYEIRNEIGDAQVVVFTQFGQEDYDLMKYLKGLGKKIAYDHNEALFGYPMEGECFRESDVIVCCSTMLAAITKNLGFGPVAVIKDALDIYKEPNVVYEDRYSKPKAVYVGMGGNSFLANEVLKGSVEKAGYELVVISEWDNANVKWNMDTWPQDMANCDVVLCPQRVEIQPAKSNVKVTTAMALGMPVIASPIQSYLEVIKHGENGYIATTLDDYYNALVALKDPEVRRKIGTAAKESVKDYTLEKIATDWKNLCEALVTNKVKDIPKPQIKAPDTPAQAREQVPIVIANYNNVKYLKLCVNSILMNTLYPFHIIISDAGSDEETWEYLRSLKGITVLGEPGKRLNFSETCNAGIRASRGKYVVVLNSDVIVSKCWLTSLVDKMNNVDRLAVCGVLSNCDRGWLHDAEGKPSYNMKLPKTGLELVPGMKYEQMVNSIEELYDFMKDSNEQYKGKFVEQPWVAAYATIFARSALDDLGLFDTRFKNGCEDLDLCVRMKKFDYKIGQALDSFIYHFGGVSRGAYESENKESYAIEDRTNHVMYQNKYERERVVIWTGPAWEPWDRKKVDEGMGGSETWASYLGRALVRKGYDVTIYNDLLAPSKDDEVRDEVEEAKYYVRYRHHSKMLEDLNYLYVDYFISSRTVEPFYHKLHTHHHYVMIHDIWLHPDQKYDILSWKATGYAYLSEWHKQFLMQHHKMPENKMFLTANGIDHSLYADVDSYQKKNQMVYSSSPDRGLYQLLLMLPEIRKAVPDFQVLVCYGFLNWESAIKAHNDEAGKQFLDKIKKVMDQPGVVYMDRISKRELAKHQMESKVWLYPTWFSETFCITCQENGASKNALLTTDFAGLATTAKDVAVMLPNLNLNRNDEYPKEYTEPFIHNAITLLTQEDLRREWAMKAYERSKIYDWDKIAEDWIQQFKK